MAKRIFDVLLAAVFLVISSPLFLVVWLFSAIDSSSSGIFLQDRIGRFGKKFKIIKFRTFGRNNKGVTAFGKILRKWKIDELPQLINVLKGTMSLVGPRPDVTGYYDQLKGEDRKLLLLKPGITSLAAIKYLNEETLLNGMDNPRQYNDTVIFPEKLKLNLEYLENQSILVDSQIIIKTIKALIYNKIH